MKTIMARSPHESSFSFSKRYFNWRKKPEELLHNHHYNEDEYNDEEVLTTLESSSNSFSGYPSEKKKPEDRRIELELELELKSCGVVTSMVPKKKLSVAKFRSIFTRSRSANHASSSSTLGSKVVGTLFGYRRGHVHIAFQEDPKANPAFLIELSTPTSVLVREMASGLVRVALECDKKVEKKGVKLLEEPLWRAYCNGKKCGYAMRRECGPDEWRVLRAIGPITMGAGVLPDEGGGGTGRVGSEGELMYMRAKFERIVGSKESEAFYMMNPDGNGGPELSVYLLRV